MSPSSGRKRPSARLLSLGLMWALKRRCSNDGLFKRRVYIEATRNPEHVVSPTRAAACKCKLTVGSSEVGTECVGTDKAGACGVAYTT